MDVTLPNGQVINNVPEGTTKEQLVQKLAASGHDTSWYSPAPTVPSSRKDIGAVEPLNMGEKALLAWDKGMSKAGEMLPDWLPSRQDVVNTAAGMSTVGGLLKNAPRIKNVADQDSAAYTLGEIADPTMMLPAAKAFKGGAQLFKRALPKLIGGGAAAGATTAVPSAARMGVEEGDISGGLGHILAGGAMGGALAPALVGAGKVGSKLYGVGQNIFAPSTSKASAYLKEALGDRTDAAISTLRNRNRAFVPGEQPTVGPVAATQGFPEFKVLEDASRRSPLSYMWQERDVANEAARLAPLENIMAPGATSFEKPLSEAQALRSRITKPLFDRASNDRVDIAQSIDDVLTAPEAAPSFRKMGDSFEQGAANAASRGQSFPAGVDIPTTSQQPLLEKALGMPEAPKPFMPQPPNRSIDELQRMKADLNLRISDLSKPGADANKLRQLLGVRDDLNATMRAQSGNYALAADMFKGLSAPQNQADVAAVLAKALRSSTGKERPAMFANAMDDALGTLRKADKSLRFKHLEKVMTPEQMRSIEGVKNSVLRQAEYDQLKATGAIEPFQSGLSKLEQETPSLLTKATTVLRKGMTTGGRLSDRSVADIVNKAMLNPEDTAKLLEGVSPRDRNKVITAMRTIGNTMGARGGITGAVVPQFNEDGSQ